MDQMSDRCVGRFDKLAENHDKIIDSLIDINKTLSEQHASLKEHMFRTELLEKRMDGFEKFIIPIRKHVLLINTLFKIIAFVGGTLATLHKLDIINLSRFF